MLDSVDTLSTFMISIVTNYFSSCGDSLEEILEGSTNSHTAFNDSSSSKETPGFNQHQLDPMVAYSVDGMAICHSIDVDNDGEPFEVQKINGTDMIFFPRPSSEMPFSKKQFIRNKHPLSRNRSNDKIRSGEIETPSFTVQNISRIATKDVISPPSEVASKWIVMGFVKENIQSPVSLLQQQQNDDDHHNQQFPFDEMKIENSKRRPPLAIRAQSRRQKQTKVSATMAGARLNS